MRALSLVVPGLFGPLPDVTGLPTPAALLTLLVCAAARDAAGADAESLLLHLFGIALTPERDPPVAALAWLGEGEGAAGGYWLRADPVHLRADQARLLLFGSRVLDVQMNEARTLATEFNAVYGVDGWWLETPHPQRWYLRLADDPRIRTHALHEVIGRSIDGLLPQGENGKRWHGVLNEVQMLFHASAVNQAREAQGRLEINSVWFWGGGYLPAVQSQNWVSVCSDAPLARGLARAAGVDSAALPDAATAWLETAGAGSRLVVLSSLQEPALYGDVDAWGAAVAELERDWFGPVLNALKAGRLDQLTLYSCDGRAFVVSRADLWRFWRRRRELGWYMRS